MSQMIRSYKDDPALVAKVEEGLPVNSQFFRPVAIVFMRYSDTLLSIARYPELA